MDRKEYQTKMNDLDPEVEEMLKKVDAKIQIYIE